MDDLPSSKPLKHSSSFLAGFPVLLFISIRTPNLLLNKASSPNEAYLSHLPSCNVIDSTISSSFYRPKKKHLPVNAKCLWYTGMGKRLGNKTFCIGIVFCCGYRVVFSSRTPLTQACILAVIVLTRFRFTW